ncbi:hypothetical protein L0244_16555, partial [bacterium]|nr:hypothetical protein [bacterium]
MKKNPGYIVVHPMNNKVLRWVSADKRGMPTAFKRAVELAAHYAAKDKMEIPVIASITRIPAGHVVTDLFYFGGGYVLVDGRLNVRQAQGMPKAIMRRENIAAKTRWAQEEGGRVIPEIYARQHMTPKPYPMAGALRRQQAGLTQAEFKRRAYEKMYAREYGNPRSRKPVEEWASFESDYEEPEVEQCPICGGEAQFMGTLGKTDWFRCRHCGAESRRQSNP